ncbi:MAG TPA: hypothetical protein VGC93_01935 [Thermoanaerobaculia bacterium]
MSNEIFAMRKEPRLACYLGGGHEDDLSEAAGNVGTRKGFLSAAAGLVGCIDGGSEDLSCSPEYLAVYGK